MSVADDVKQAIEDFTSVLGESVCTPEWINDGGGAIRKAKYRAWHWPCPICRAGFEPDLVCGIEVVGLTKPLTLDSEGNIRCHLCGADPERIVVKIGELLEERQWGQLLEGWA